MRSVNYRERREVAERLRKASDHGHGISCDAVDKALGIWYDDSYSGCVFARESVLRLADLIDPITTVELRAPWTICMKCGARMEGYQHKPVRFCPHFGRRIVR